MDFSKLTDIDQAIEVLNNPEDSNNIAQIDKSLEWNTKATNKHRDSVEDLIGDIMGNGGDKKTDRGNPGFDTPEGNKRDSKVTQGVDYDDEQRVGGQN